MTHLQKVLDDQWREGYALLVKYGLSFDLQIFWQQMADAADLARTFADIERILNHTGMPRRRDPEYVANWRGGMRTLAATPNVAVKISGLAIFVLDMIEICGTRRCMFAPNFPSIDRTPTMTRSGAPSIGSPPPFGGRAPRPCSTTTPPASIV